MWSFRCQTTVSMSHSFAKLSSSCHALCKSQCHARNFSVIIHPVSVNKYINFICVHLLYSYIFYMLIADNVLFPIYQVLSLLGIFLCLVLYTIFAMPHKFPLKVHTLNHLIRLLLLLTLHFCSYISRV